jgi:hypothetical protein
MKGGEIGGRRRAGKGAEWGWRREGREEEGSSGVGGEGRGYRGRGAITMCQHPVRLGVQELCTFVGGADMSSWTDAQAGVGERCGQFILETKTALGGKGAGIWGGGFVGKGACSKQGRPHHGVTRSPAAGKQRTWACMLGCYQRTVYEAQGCLRPSKPSAARSPDGSIQHPAFMDSGCACVAVVGAAAAAASASAH